MSKRLLIIDTDSSGLDVAIRAQQWGWEVLWYDRPRKDGTYSNVGKGIITKIKDYDLLRSRYLHWADLIWLTDNKHYMEMLEPFRKLGFPIWGGGVESAKWELDRAVGQKVMKDAGLNIIPGKEFHDHDSAIAYVKKHGTPFASKPSGEADKAMTYVADSAADLVYNLEQWKKNEKYRKDAAEFGFILQEKKTGCEMGVSGWFGPGGWSQYWGPNFEYKKELDGDLGVNTGEQGTLLYFTTEEKLADIALRPLTEQLKAIGYVGCVDVNGCIDDKGDYWPFELCMREGWPAKYNEMALQDGDPIQWMLDCCNGEDTVRCRTKECSISIVVSIKKEVEGVPIYNAGDMEHVHFDEIMLARSVPTQAGNKVVDMPGYVCAGGHPLVITGTGETITGARRSAYTALDKIKLCRPPGWRLDIGRSKLVENLPKIQRHGYAKGLTY